MCHADRKYGRIDLNLVAIECRSPIEIPRAENDWLLICTVLQYGDMQRLIQLEEHSWVELSFFVVTDEFKHKSLVKDWVARGLHDRSRVAILQEAHSD